MSATVQEKPASRSEAFVSSTLDRARARVRLLDLAAGGFGLAALVLAFVCLMAVLDRTFILSAPTRQFTLILFLSGAGAYAWFALIRPLRMDVNPHYAARLLEEEAGTGRNNVLNWIDLQGERLPSVFRAGINSRAAKDLQRADLEKAISGRRAWMAAALFSASLFCFVLLFAWLGLRPFSALVGRAAVPFAVAGDVPTRTQVGIVKPEGGDAVVTVGTPVTIVASVGGRVPRAGDSDAPTLKYRQSADEPYRRSPLTRDEASGEWLATLAPADVGAGFSYHVTAGDGFSKEHLITTRSAPLLGDFLARYRYRPYVGKADRTRTARKLDDLRGTEVTITARGNRHVKEARLDFQPNDGPAESIRGDVGENDPFAPRFRLVLDRPGKYRLSYTSVEGETYQDAEWSEVAVTPDMPPTVRLIHPGADIKAPANGTVELEGDAADDHGIGAMELHLAVEGGQKLPSRPYMADKLGKQGFGTPRAMHYRATLALGPLDLQPGTVIEYWLEARDACDFPKPNSASTQKYKITLEAAGDEAARKQKEEAARKKQVEHDRKQEEKLKKEAAARQEQKEKEEKEEKEDAKAREKNGAGKAGKDEKKEDKGGNDPKDPKDPKDEGTEKTAQKLQDALNKNERGKPKEEKGEGKGAGEKPGEAKPAKPDDKPGEGRDGAGMNKDDKPGESKDTKKGPPGEGEGKGSDGKPGGESKPGKGDGGSKGEGKPADKADGAGKGKGGDGPPAGTGKGGGGMGDRPGESKGDGEGGAGEPKGEGKPGGMGGDGEGRGGAGDGNKGEGKAAGKGTGGGKAPGQAPGGAAPGTGKPGDQRTPAHGGGPGDPTPPGAKEKPRDSRAVMLQLEELRKKITPDMLKDAKMSREQFEAFLRDMKELARRRAEHEEAVRATGSNLPSSVGRPPAPGAKSDDLRGGGRPKPPPEYTEGHAEFLKELSREK